MYKQGGSDPIIVENLMGREKKLNLYDPLTLIATIGEYKPLFQRGSKDNISILTPENKNKVYRLFDYWSKDALLKNNVFEDDRFKYDH